jgi:hypothetical protein
MDNARKKRGRSPLSIPVLCSLGGMFFVGLVVGPLVDTPIHPIVVISGFVAALVVYACLYEWLESRARTALEARDKRVRPGWISAEAIPQPTDRHMN